MTTERWRHTPSGFGNPLCPVCWKDRLLYRLRLRAEPHRCPRCLGSGALGKEQNRECRACDGTGFRGEA